jgi:hypothetical protein
MTTTLENVMEFVALRITDRLNTIRFIIANATRLKSTITINKMSLLIKNIV